MIRKKTRTQMWVVACSVFLAMALGLAVAKEERAYSVERIESMASTAGVGSTFPATQASSSIWITETPAYEVVLSAGGIYTVGTGPDHPVTQEFGQRLNVMTGGVISIPQESTTSIRSFTSGTDYFLSDGRLIFQDSPDFDCLHFGDLGFGDIRKILRVGREVGLATSWLVEEPLDHFILEIKLEVHGDEFEDGSVEVTTTIENLATEPLELGIRYHWGVHIFKGLHPTYGFVPPAPPVEPYEQVETEFLDPAFATFLASRTPFPSREDYLYFNAGSVTGPAHLDPLPTPPHRIVLGPSGAATRRAWERGPEFQGVGNSCFDYALTPGTGLEGDSTINYWWGADRARAIVAAPGQAVSVTQYVWAFIENPLVCEAGGPYMFECKGDPTSGTLDGSRSTTREGNEVLYHWASTDPRVAFADPSAEQPEVSFPGVGVYHADLGVAIGPYVESCQTDVEVIDSIPPVLRVPSPVKLRTSAFGPDACALPWTITADAEDQCADDIQITHRTIPDIGSGGSRAHYSFPLGTTKLIFTAEDPSGNRTTAETSVTIVDDTPPLFERLAVSPAELWPPNHRMVEVEVEAEARDNCDLSPDILLHAVTSSESPDEQGDGHTLTDIVGAASGTPDFDISLRAERDGRGDGREYVLTYEVRDESGNRTLENTRVSVPHDRRPSTR